MRYLLANKDKLHFEQRAGWSFIAEPTRLGYFRLFNKNAGTTAFVYPIMQVENEMSWVVEAQEPIDPYFKNVLRPYEEDGDKTPDTL